MVAKCFTFVKMTEQQLKELEDTGSPVCTEAAGFIRNIMQSPFYTGYVTIKSSIDKWNMEIQSSEISLTSSKDDKSFERAHKYLTEMKPYYEQLEYFRANLTSKKLVDAEIEVNSLMDEARIKLNEKNKKRDVAV